MSTPPANGFDSAASGDDTTPLAERSLTDDELADLVSADEAPAAVTFSSQDFDVAGLVRRLQRESMLIPQLGSRDERVETAGFQRGFVWSRAQMDKFIESLLLGYPVPGIFLVRQTDQRMLVLDGQQRLVTVKRFTEGTHNEKPFVLTNVSDDFKGFTYATLPEDLQRKLDDSYMQATIVVADGSAEVSNAIYQIFERLNSGGTQLTPHEIRVALAAGPLIDYLEDLNSDVNWRQLYGGRSARLRDQELVLRILALFLEAASYARPLKTFLNNFATEHRSPSPDITRAGNYFRSAADRLSHTVGPEAFRRPGVSQVNVAQAEAVMVGVMRALAESVDLATDLTERVAILRTDSDFVYATTRSTADTDSVALRLRVAAAAVRGS